MACQGTSTLAYYEHWQITAIKSFITFGPEQFVQQGYVAYPNQAPSPMGYPMQPGVGIPQGGMAYPPAGAAYPPAGAAYPPGTNVI